MQKHKRKKKQVKQEQNKLFQPPPKIKQDRPITKQYQMKIVANGDINLSVQHFFTQGQPNTKIYCIKFDCENKYIAAGIIIQSACQNGQIRVYSIKKKILCYTMKSENSKTPFSYLRWRPQNDSFKTKNIFITTNSQGQIQYWHLRSQKCLATLRDQNKQIIDKQLYCVDYNPQGSKIIACGSQPIVKIYDQFKKKKQMNLGSQEFTLDKGGHCLRVYCAKFAKDNNFVAYSGGWDRSLIVWDIRTGKKPVQSIFGPQICGDGIDISSSNGEQLKINSIVTASWTQTDQLQRWQTRKKIRLNQTIDWDSIKISQDPCFLYACKFNNKQCDIIAAGGSNANELKLFDLKNSSKAFCCIYDLPREIDTIDFSYDDTLIAFSGADGYIRVFKIK